jgi:hypothetical protein
LPFSARSNMVGHRENHFPIAIDRKYDSMWGDGDGQGVSDFLALAGSPSGP